MKLNITFNYSDDGGYDLLSVVPTAHPGSDNPLLAHLEIREWSRGPKGLEICEWSRGPQGLLFHYVSQDKPVDESVWIHSLSPDGSFTSLEAAKSDFLERLRAAVGEFVVVETDQHKELLRRALLALDEGDFPHLREDLRMAIRNYPRNQSAAS